MDALMNVVEPVPSKCLLIDKCANHFTIGRASVLLVDVPEYVVSEWDGN